MVHICLDESNSNSSKYSSRVLCTVVARSTTSWIKSCNDVPDMTSPTYGNSFGRNHSLLPAIDRVCGTHIEPIITDYNLLMFSIAAIDDAA